MSWEVVVGIETHAQLLTRSKIFSAASTAFGAPANTHASAVDIALPATPVPPMPEWSDDIRRNVERQAYRLMQDQQLREIIGRVRAQAREEARLRRWRREF